METCFPAVAGGLRLTVTLRTRPGQHRTESRGCRADLGQREPRSLRPSAQRWGGVPGPRSPPPPARRPRQELVFLAEGSPLELSCNFTFIAVLRL